jgi:hypothetical protein
MCYAIYLDYIFPEKVRFGLVFELVPRSKIFRPGLMSQDTPSAIHFSGKRQAAVRLCSLRLFSRRWDFRKSHRLATWITLSADVSPVREICWARKGSEIRKSHGTKGTPRAQSVRPGNRVGGKRCRVARNTVRGLSVHSIVATPAGVGGDQRGAKGLATSYRACLGLRDVPRWRCGRWRCRG